MKAYGIKCPESAKCPDSANKGLYERPVSSVEIFNEAGLPLFNPLLTPMYLLIHDAIP